MDNNHPGPNAAVDRLRLIAHIKTARAMFAFKHKMYSILYVPGDFWFEDMDAFLKLFCDVIEHKVYQRLLGDPEFRQRCIADYERDMEAEREAASRLDEARRLGVFIHPGDQSLTK